MRVLQPPSAPGQNGVWLEGPLRKRAPEKRSHTLLGRGLQRRLCVLKSDGLYYYAEGGKEGGKGDEARGKIPTIAIRSVRLCSASGPLFHLIPPPANTNPTVAPLP